LNDPAASEAMKRGTLYTLINVLEILLRLLHPFIPFITEELWQKIAPMINKQAKTIMLQSYPRTNEVASDKESVGEINWVKSFILGVRRIRAERDIAPGKPLAVQVMGGKKNEQHWLQSNTDYLKTLARIENINKIETAPDDAVLSLAGDMTVLVPLADLIDPKAELEKLKKEIDKLNNERQQIQAKLENRNFTDRAPEDVVNKQRERLNETIATIGKLEDQRKRIAELVN
jgi:valyl-tRNA synthetase